MFQQRPFIARCFLACVTALGGLFAVSRLSLAATPPSVTSIVSDRSPAITPTDSIDRLPENGTFVDLPAILPGVQFGSADWGDCNNDGASDLLLTGQVSLTRTIAHVYQQQGTSFPLAAAFSDVIYGAAAWGDYDSDGWLDVVLTGESSGVPISRLYRNARVGAICTFSAVNVNLVGVRHSTVAWGDYNSDGQIDLLLAGDDGSQLVTKIYRNNHGSFSDSGLILPGIRDGAAAWGDYNGDGLADLLLTGATTGTNKLLTKIYRNNGQGALIEISTSLPALVDSAAAWGDYDNDGDLDLLLEGKTSAYVPVAEVYRNDQGVFVRNAAASSLMGGLTWSGAAWGDYDNDGYLDALISSESNAKAYRNEITGSFALTGLPVGPLLASGTATWGHYDNNGDLEAVVTGQSSGGLVTKICKYVNFNLPANVPPQAPTNLTSTLTGATAVLRWSPPGGDDHTPLTGLSYNLLMGTQPGGVDIIAPMAITSTGYRLLPALGNVYQARSVTLSNLPLGKTYYWSVQAIDTSFLGSAFAAEGSFRIPYRAFLPVVLKNFINYYANAWETEPNNTYLQANGPLKSGQIYQGVHNDERDFYSVYLPISGTLNVDMGSPNQGTQIQLFYQIADVDHRVGSDVSPPYEIDYAGAAGWYYIWVYTNPAYVGTQTYTLTVTYP